MRVKRLWLTAKLLLLAILGKIKRRIRPAILEYRFRSKALAAPEEHHQHEGWPDACPSCGMPVTSSTTREEVVTHNPQTCPLVNLVLTEMGVVLDQQVRVEIYQASGPLRGFYTTVDPYAIHVSVEAHSQFPEYIIFHETKHLVDCVTKGWSEEGTPDKFARYLCLKYGYRWPPPHQHTGLVVFNGICSGRDPKF